MALTSQGVDVRGDQIHIIADVITETLGIPCSALSGANIADEGAWPVTLSKSPADVL